MPPPRREATEDGGGEPAEPVAGQTPVEPLAMPWPDAGDEIEPASGQADLRPADGEVWVADGVLRVRNPVGLGRWPCVSVDGDSGVRLTVNGVKVDGDVVLRAEDDVRLQTGTFETPASVEVTVAPDGMAAWMTVTPARRESIVLPDAPPTVRLRLQARSEVEVVPDQLTDAEVRAALADRRVCAGIDDEAVAQALAEPGRTVLVARGRPPEEGQPSTVWSCVHGPLSGPDEALPEVSGVAAPRPFVEIGQPALRITPGAPGVPGETVTGDALPAAPVWLPALVAGSGVILSADGVTAIAARSGHPRVAVGREQVTVSTFPERRLAGDVDVQTGDVEEAGDVWVGGSVQSGTAIHAGGSVEVRGRAIRARIEATGGVRVHGGAVHAVLLAGGPGLLYAQMVPLGEQLERLLQGGATEPGGPSARRQAAVLAARLQLVLHKAETRLDPAVDALGEYLLPLARLAAGQDLAGPLDDLLTRAEAPLRTAMSTMRSTLAQPAVCYARNLESTTVQATGDVEIGDGGALCSQVVTLGLLSATGPFRGGAVLALRGAICASVGSGPDVPTRIEVGERGRFEAAEVLPGTTVVRGDLTRHFDTAAHEVTVGDT